MFLFYVKDDAVWYVDKSVECWIKNVVMYKDSTYVYCVNCEEGKTLCHYTMKLMEQCILYSFGRVL